MATLKNRPARWAKLETTLVMLLGLSGGANLAARSALAQAPGAAAVQTLQFRTTAKLADDPPVIQRWYLAGDKVRADCPAGQAEVAERPDAGVLASMIIDLGAKRGLEIDYLRQRAWRTTTPDETLHNFQNAIGRMRNIVAQGAKFLRDENVDGRAAHVYELEQVEFLFIPSTVSERDAVYVWVDAQSMLPIRMQATSPGGEMPSDIVFDEFVWNEPLMAEAFALEPPPGFQVKDKPQAP